MERESLWRAGTQAGEEVLLIFIQEFKAEAEGNTHIKVGIVGIVQMK